MDFKSRFIIVIVVLNIFMLGYLLVAFNLGINNLNMGFLMGRLQVKKDYGDVDTKVSITQESIVSSELVIQVEDQTGKILTEVKRNSLVPSMILVMMLVNGLMLVFYFLRQPILKWLKIH